VHWQLGKQCSPKDISLRAEEGSMLLGVDMHTRDLSPQTIEIELDRPNSGWRQLEVTMFTC